MVRATYPRKEIGGFDLAIFIQKRKGTLTVSGKEMANVIAVAESSDTSSIKVHCLLSFLNTVQRTKREVTSLAYCRSFHSTGHVLQPICRCIARFRQIRHPCKRFLETIYGLHCFQSSVC